MNEFPKVVAGLVYLWPNFAGVILGLFPDLGTGRLRPLIEIVLCMAGLIALWIVGVLILKILKKALYPRGRVWKIIGVLFNLYMIIGILVYLTYFVLAGGVSYIFYLINSQ